MAILDKLVEKKDVLAYINYRLEEIKETQREFIRKDKRNTNEAKSYFKTVSGRTKELMKLKSIIQKNIIKTESKRIYDKINISKKNSE